MDTKARNAGYYTGREAHRSEPTSIDRFLTVGLSPVDDNGPDGADRELGAKRILRLLGTFQPGTGVALNQATMMPQQPAPRILIVDDEPEIRAFMCDALGAFGYQVSAAADAEEAFAFVARSRFDLVMSDLRLPGLRGWDFVAKLRSIDPTLPVIMLTGSSPDDDDLRRVREGGIPVLHKPVPLPQLQAALTEALRGRAA